MSGVSLVAKPRAKLIGIVVISAVLQRFWILCITRSTDLFVVFGNNIKNSSPPQRVTMSAYRQLRCKIFAMWIKSSSPCLCAKASLTSFNPLISPMIIESGN